jgi:hypothetical protein
VKNARVKNAVAASLLSIGVPFFNSPTREALA